MVIHPGSPDSLRIEVQTPGDLRGNGALLRLHPPGGPVIHAIGVDQGWAAPTGPTWAYLLETDPLTLIDAGGLFSFPYLTAGLALAGVQPAQVQRLIITHGHLDHDGAALPLLQASGGQLWAHQAYASLLEAPPWSPPSPEGQSALHRALEQTLRALAATEGDDPGIQRRAQRHRQHQEARRHLRIGRALDDREQADGLTFLYTPGHSADHLCIALGELLFTGDHVLPDITPHPTMQAGAPQLDLPGYPHSPWGLEAYLRSLKRLRALPPETVILPAHRLFRRGHLRLLTVQRAQAIVQHHLQRLDQILDHLQRGPATLEQLTARMFSGRNLAHGNMYLALTEAVSHLELLEEAGDVEVTASGTVEWRGSRGYRTLEERLEG